MGMNFFSPVPPENRPARYLADEVVDRVERHLKDVLDDLKEDETVSVVVPLADGTRITTRFFGYRNPNLIIVDGSDQNGIETHALIAHTAIQIIIRVLKKQADQPKATIGFQPR